MATLKEKESDSEKTVGLLSITNKNLSSFCLGLWIPELLHNQRTVTFTMQDGPNWRFFSPTADRTHKRGTFHALMKPGRSVVSSADHYQSTGHLVLGHREKNVVHVISVLCYLIINEVLFCETTRYLPSRLDTCQDILFGHVLKTSMTFLAPTSKLKP